MTSNYTIKSRGAIALAVICWGLATGLAVEKVIADGVQSWTLLVGVCVLTACAGLLLHEAFADLKEWRPIRGTVALALAILSLCVTLPASIGSSSQARDTAAAASAKSTADILKIKADLDATEKLVKEAQKWADDECKTGNGPECKGKTFILEQRQRSAKVLKDELKDHAPAKPVEAGEERIAWVLGLFGLAISPADVGRVWPMLPPIAFEVLSAWFLTRGLGRDTPVDTPVSTGVGVSDTAQTSFDVSRMAALPPPSMFGPIEAEPAPQPPKPKRRRKRKSKHENAAAWLKSEAEKNGGVPNFRVVQARFHLSKASASRIRSEVIREIEKAA